MGACWTLRCLLISIALLLLAACSNGTGSVEERPPTQSAQEAFTVGGAVSGLSGQGLVLRNNGADDLAVSANGSFSFPITVATGAPYNVTVRTQPTSPAQTCSVSNGSGTMGAANVTSVAVSCLAGAISIGGTVTGLNPGSSVALTNNGGDRLDVTSNGSFVFPTAVATGNPYFVTVSTNPLNPPQNCAVTNGSGTASTSNVTNIVVTCSSNYTVGGTITGLVGSGLTLQVNGAHDLTIPAGTSQFAFDTFLSSGAAYDVRVRTQPSRPAQTCTVANGSGTVSGSNVTNVAVTCAVPTYFIGGRISGLRGMDLVLQNNGQDDLSIRSDGEFTFPIKVQHGATYNVAVRTQPRAPLQECTIANHTGTATGDVRNVEVTCATRTFRLFVNVTGLEGSGLRLRNSGGAPLSIPGNGLHEFPQQVADGSTYEVTVERQPTMPTQSCVPSNGSGTMGAQDLTVNVVCTTSTFSVRGTVNNLVGTGLVLQNNLQTLTVNTSSFEFAAIPSGSTYNIQVQTQPSGPRQACSVSNGSGTVLDRHIENVRIDCVTIEFSIGGQISNLVGAGLSLQNNGADDLQIAANGQSVLFTFRGSLTQGSPYNVTVASQPVNPAQECVVNNGSGTVGTQNVSNVQVACTTVEFTVGGSVTGLTGSTSSLVLQNNGPSNTVEIVSNGDFTFPLRVRTGQSYNVLILMQPNNRFCTVTNGSGVMGSAAVDNVRVLCIPWLFP